jgi:cytochrome P450
LRFLSPVLVVQKRVFVARHADIVEVLSRDDEFTISEINGARTARDNGPFVLGMDRGPAHDREKALLNAVMRRDDVARIRQFVANEAAGLLQGVREKGRVDVVGDFARLVPLRVIETYFGTPAASVPSMQHWLRSLFHDLFLNLSDDPTVITEAVRSFQELRPYLEGIIAERRAAPSVDGSTDDVLGRMIALSRDDAYGDWLDDEAICRNISGLIIGALETTNKAVVHVMDELLRRPHALHGAAAAAVAGNVDRVRGYAFEALRFNPFVPLLVRYCRTEKRLGENAGQGRAVPPQSTVYALTLSAMFDSRAVEDPGTFRPDRELEYLHFGHGLHQCQGRLINNVQVPELVAALLRLPGLRRARGSQGRVRYDGPFPIRFVLEFDRR